MAGPAYVEHGAVVSGPAAAVLSLIARSPHVRTVLEQLPPWARPYRVEIAAVVDALHRAGSVWAAGVAAAVRDDEAAVRETERVARELISQLPARDQMTVRGLMQLGFDHTTAYLECRRGSNARQAAARARDEALDELLVAHIRRVEVPDAAKVRMMISEHEAAHALVAQELGAPVSELFVDEDGRSGGCWHVEPADRVDAAAMSMAGYVWIRTFRHLEYPRGDHAWNAGDRRSVADLVDDVGAREAHRRCTAVLRAHGDRVLQLARILNERGRVCL